VQRKLTYWHSTLELADSRIDFDMEKYQDMFLDAGETVLSTFSFSREAYGRPNRSRSWLAELREETIRDRELELHTEEKDFPN
jgi:hypothetical protein